VNGSETTFNEAAARRAFLLAGRMPVGSSARCRPRATDRTPLERTGAIATSDDSEGFVGAGRVFGFHSNEPPGACDVNKAIAKKSKGSGVLDERVTGRTQARAQNWLQTDHRVTNGSGLFATQSNGSGLLVSAGPCSSIKAKKKRLYVPIGMRALVWIARYVEQARDRLLLDETERTLFVTNQGEPLNPDSLTEYVRRSIAAAGN